MFNFLKSIFKKEELVRKETVKIDQLEEWLENKIANIDFKEEITEFFNQLKDKKYLLGEKLDVLEQAEIDEKEKVDDKVKNIVRGHKDNYIREMRRFLERVEVPEESLQGAIDFSLLLNKNLDELAKRTAKSYQAAQHLYFKPVEEVFKAVGEINKLAQEFGKRLESKNLDQIGEIKKKVKFLLEERNKRKRLEEDLKWKLIKLERSKESKKKNEGEIERLRGSPDYQELLTWKEKEEKLRTLRKDNQDEVYLFFSRLGRALRKYEKITMEVKLVQAYLEDGVKAFFADEGLQIKKVLEGMSKSIEKGELDLDEKTKDAAVEMIKKGKTTYLDELLERGKDLQKRIEEIKGKLRRYNVDKQIEEAEYKSEHFEEQTVLVKREIEELKVKLSALGEEKLEEELKKLVEELLKIEINLEKQEVKHQEE